jgi:hypothetical protein
MRSCWTRRATVVLLAAATLVAACRNRQAQDVSRPTVQAPADAKSRDEGKLQAAANVAASAADPLAAMFAARKLIRSAQISLEVARFDDAAAEAARIVEFHGGYVAGSAASNPGDGVRSGSLTLRLPGDRFPRALESLKKIGKVQIEQVTTEDVSRAYADLETRLRVKREAASRLREILRGRTAKLADILEVEQALMAVVEEIEQMEGQRRFYDNQVALSTIQVSISEPAPLVRRGALAPIGDAARQALGVLVGSVAALITLGVAVLPWALLLIALLWSVRRTLRRRRAASAREGAAPA